MKNEYSGRRLIRPRLIRSPAYYGHFFRVRIFPSLLCVKETRLIRSPPPLNAVKNSTKAYVISPPLQSSWARAMTAHSTDVTFLKLTIVFV